MAEVQRNRIALLLDDHEAGYLLDLLQGHVGGTLTLDYEPLGRIRQALNAASVKRLYPNRSDQYGAHGYAVLDSPSWGALPEANVSPDRA